MSSPRLWGRALQARPPGAQGTHSLGQSEGHLGQVLGLRLCLKSEGDSGSRWAPPAPHHLACQSICSLHQALEGGSLASPAMLSSSNCKDEP